MNKAIFEIFKTGVRNSSNGLLAEWSKERLQRIAQCYNPAIFNAPLVIGHPESNKPEYGHVKRLFEHNGVLFAECDLADSLLSLIKQGRYKFISSSFFLPDSAKNPFKGRDYLRHVGFLGAMPPAVKGLQNAQTSTANIASYNEIEIGDFLCFSEQTYRQETESEKLHRKTLYIQQQCNGMSYKQALSIALNQ